MPLFICAKCGCVENTALSTYWFRKNCRYTDGLEEYQDKPLCSECGAVVYDDNHNKGLIVPGRWHGRFPKKPASEDYKRRADKDGRIH